MYTVKQYQAKRIEQMAFVKTFIPDFDMQHVYRGESIEGEDKKYNWYVTLRNEANKKEMGLEYHMGSAYAMIKFTGFDGTEHTVPQPPLPMEVLSCIYSDSAGCCDTFEDWCNEYGYDTDSRKALDIYFACQKESADFRKTFPGIDLSEIEEIANY